MANVSLINIGVSALKAQQAALATTGHNIANAGTPGYSRQRVELAAAPPARLGTSFQGAGVDVQTIRRMADEFLTNQIRLDGSVLHEAEAFLAQVSRIDSMLAAEGTGLLPTLNAFFGAMQAAASAPASIPARQLVLSKAQALVDRFHALHARLTQQATTVSRRTAATVDRISELAEAVAGLNERIARAEGTSPHRPANDLLDQRDELLRQLSELIAVNVVRQQDGQLNVFVGKGQSLVQGSVANRLGYTGAGQVTLAAAGQGAPQVITSSVTGGELGGLLRFSATALAPAFNRLGLLATAVSELVNTQHRAGVTLDGGRGGNVFLDINAPAVAANRVQALPGNSSNDQLMSVTIDDVAALTATDYTLRFTSAGSYELTRAGDGAAVAHGNLVGNFPHTISAEGFTLTIEAGSFAGGDAFLLRPTRFAAGDVERTISDPRDLALASPLALSGDLGNRGTGSLERAMVLDIDHPSFAEPGALSPPLLIRFTSPSSYEILDNSDPAAPVPLTPPLENLPYVPGIENGVLPAPGDTLVLSEGAVAGALPGAAQTVAGLVPVANAVAAENLTVTTRDDAGALVSQQTVTVNAGDSARAVADALDALTGVSASAVTELEITAVNDDGAGVPFAVAINGTVVTLPPAPSLNDLADAISADPTLAAAGITAESDGQVLMLRAVAGDDLSVHVGGDATDTLALRDTGGATLTLTGAVAGSFNTVTVAGRVSVRLTGNVSMTSDASGAGNLFTATPNAVPSSFGYQVTMTGRPEAGDTFEVSFNALGTSDNRNALAIASLNGRPVLGGGSATFVDSYSALIEFVGAATSQARLDRDGARGLLDQAVATRESLSGVNLDEEAANLIRFEQAYNASARVIQVARDTFDVLFRLSG